MEDAVCRYANVFRDYRQGAGLKLNPEYHWKVWFNYVTANLFMACICMSPCSSDYLIRLLLGARGRVIVGTHRLVSTPSVEPVPSTAWLGIVSYESFTEFTQFNAD